MTFYAYLDETEAELINDAFENNLVMNRNIDYTQQTVELINKCNKNDLFTKLGIKYAGSGLEYVVKQDTYDFILLRIYFKIGGNIVCAVISNIEAYIYHSVFSKFFDYNKVFKEGKELSLSQVKKMFKSDLLRLEFNIFGENENNYYVHLVPSIVAERDIITADDINLYCYNELKFSNINEIKSVLVPYLDIRYINPLNQSKVIYEIPDTYVPSKILDPKNYCAMDIVSDPFTIKYHSLDDLYFALISDSDEVFINGMAYFMYTYRTERRVLAMSLISVILAAANTRASGDDTFYGGNSTFYDYKLLMLVSLINHEAYVGIDDSDFLSAFNASKYIYINDLNELSHLSEYVNSFFTMFFKPSADIDVLIDITNTNIVYDVYNILKSMQVADKCFDIHDFLSGDILELDVFKDLIKALNTMLLNDILNTQEMLFTKNPYQYSIDWFYNLFTKENKYYSGYFYEGDSYTTKIVELPDAKIYLVCDDIEFLKDTFIPSLITDILTLSDREYNLQITGKYASSIETFNSVSTTPIFHFYVSDDINAHDIKGSITRMAHNIRINNTSIKALFGDDLDDIITACIDTLGLEYH